jgi:hypothetical protein
MTDMGASRPSRPATNIEVNHDTLDTCDWEIPAKTLGRSIGSRTDTSDQEYRVGPGIGFVSYFASRTDDR